MSKLASALFLGDCLNELKAIETGSVDLVLTDPPYGTTRCKWDSVIPLKELWEQLRRVAKKEAAVVMHASQPFTTALISSNLKDFRYCWIWEKAIATGHLNAKRRPMVSHEEIVVFSRQAPPYNPQKTTGHNLTSRKRKGNESDCYGVQVPTNYASAERYPRSVQRFKSPTRSASMHPTQKPLDLIEYLLKTYSTEGDTVLDFAMGSGTTGVAARNLSRAFIGIELDPLYFDMAKKRIQGST